MRGAGRDALCARVKKISMRKIKRIRVKSAAGSYAVVCGAAVLARLSRENAKIGKFSSIHVVTSRKVWAAVGKRVLRGLGGVKAAQVHKFDDAESAKHLRSVESIARGLVKAGADRHAVVIAVGGGVVGDVAGFAAASYLRGVALVQVPTTLVAQTDSAIGGKTGVNLPEGKNLVGAFYPARLVVVDTETLATLPEREFRGGLAEVIKYGVTAALYGHEIRVTPVADASRIISLIRRMGKLPAWPKVPAKRLIELMGSDKKTRDGKLRFVLTPGIGNAATFDAREPEKLELILRVTARVAQAQPVLHG